MLLLLLLLRLVWIASTGTRFFAFFRAFYYKITLFCYKITKNCIFFAFFCEKILSYQKNVVPLHQIFKKEVTEAAGSRQNLIIFYNMKSTNLFATLLAVATANPDGFTVSASNLQTVTTGYAVAVRETQNSFGTDGLRRVINYARKDSRVSAFGGWLDSETGLFYWDAVIICSSIEEAETIARENEQIAYFDLNTCTEIRL